MGVVDVAGRFAQVRPRQDVASLVIGRFLVRHPNLDLGNLDARRDEGQPGHPRVILVAEVLGEEEVAVLVVGRCLDFINLGGDAALGADGLGRRLLFGQQGRDVEFAELEARLDAEEGRSARDERVAGRHRHIAGLEILDDVILLTAECQFEFVGIEVERGFGIVVEVKTHLGAHLGIHVELDVLFEIHRELVAGAFRERGIVNLVAFHAQRDGGRALGLDAQAALAEDFFGRTQRELHVEEVEFAAGAPFLLGLLVGFAVEFAEIGGTYRAFGIIHILRTRHGDAVVQILVADAGVDHVAVVDGVVFYLLLEIGGRFEVDGVALFKLLGCL